MLVRGKWSQILLKKCVLKLEIKIFYKVGRTLFKIKNLTLPKKIGKHHQTTI